MRLFTMTCALKMILSCSYWSSCLPPVLPFFTLGLPDERGCVQILNIHTARMREDNFMTSDVEIGELATETKNFSGAELEGLVRAAQSTAMNRHIKATTKVEVNMEKAEQLQVTKVDFLTSLENNIKPVSCPAVNMAASHTLKMPVEITSKLVKPADYLIYLTQL
ncbi:vesicle-fusing ATPase-like [Hyla sarda]|uniref:vesicle-fusing ATPase-like n=1 Tax=Hyla sarda TaxID=327740 RepID=UPI0024C30C14|nr:vesicle-fusing ATPase-like [Hyla sarda]